MAKASAFYSWQSDLPGKTNRGLIQHALERVAKKQRTDDTLGMNPSLIATREASQARPTSWLSKVTETMGIDAPAYKRRYEERWKLVARSFGNTMPFLAEDLSRILLEPKHVGSQT